MGGEGIRVVVPPPGAPQKRSLAVLYGSQTGNAQAIAERLAEEASARGYSATLEPLNRWKNLDPPISPMSTAADLRPVVIVCSTTGNADPPENCERFWRFIKKRTQPGDLMAGLLYATLGLGDTNYDKFCYMGKSIHARLRELGGRAFYDLACADEGTGTMEETIEPWIEGLWEALAELWNVPTQDDRDSGGAAGVAEDARLTARSSEGAPAPAPAAAQNPPPLSTSFEPPQDGKVDLSESIAALGISELPATLDLPRGFEAIDSFLAKSSSAAVAAAVQGELNPAETPRIRSSMRVQFRVVSPQECAAEVHSSGTRRGRESSISDRYSSEFPFSAKVKAKRYLTAGGRDSERRVLQLDLDLEGSGIDYIPGDAIGVRCPNRRESVAFMLSLASSDVDDPDTVLDLAGGPFPSRLTLRELFESYADLQATPRKAAIRALAEHCDSEFEKRIMLLLSSRTVGSSIYTSYIVDQCLSVPELLAAFPSCRPPLSVLIGVLTALPPRYYSCASSSMADKSILSIALTIHSFHSAGILRKGLCTEWLEGVACYKEDIPIFLRPTKEFYLPGSLKSPCILIGPGTGVAPFMGFLQHRQALARNRVEKEEAASCGQWRCGFDVDFVPLERLGSYNEWIESQGEGPIWLFFGNRSSSQDWIFRDEMEGYLQDGTLSRLLTAFSRDGPQKVYVTHRMLEVGADLARMILREEAYVFVCGDGKTMARDVHKTLVEILEKHGGVGVDEAAAELQLSDMKKRRRYVMDVWS